MAISLIFKLLTVIFDSESVHVSSISLVSLFFIVTGLNEPKLHVGPVVSIWVIPMLLDIVLPSLSLIHI